jgi:hypothetical protein
MHQQKMLASYERVNLPSNVRLRLVQSVTLTSIICAYLYMHDRASVVRGDDGFC